LYYLSICLLLALLQFSFFASTFSHYFHFYFSFYC
jgi:hypothetical protein